MSPFSVPPGTFPRLPGVQAVHTGHVVLAVVQLLTRALMCEALGHHSRRASPGGGVLTARSEPVNSFFSDSIQSRNFLCGTFIGNEILHCFLWGTFTKLLNLRKFLMK